MLYREAGQFKTSYRADQALFPILQDKIGIILIAGGGLHSGAARRIRLRDRFVHHADSHLFARRHRAQSAHRLYRIAVARHRRLHGRRRIRLLQAHDLLSGHQHHRADHLLRLFCPRRPASCSACPACASKASIWRLRRSPRSSSCPGASSAFRGCTITISPLRSKCRNGCCSAYRSPDRRRPWSRAISSCSRS